MAQRIECMTPATPRPTHRDGFAIPPTSSDAFPGAARMSARPLTSGTWVAKTNRSPRGRRLPTHSLAPQIVADPWSAHRSRVGPARVFRMLGYLALAASAAAAVAFVAVSNLSLQGATGATEQADNLNSFGSRFVEHSANPQDPSGLTPRGSKARDLLALADAWPATPVTTALAEPTPAANLAARDPAEPNAANIAGPGPALPTPKATTLDSESEEAATLVKRGQQLAAAGDIAAARLVLRHVAEAHNARAALALGATYDPNVLKTLGIHGIAPDIPAARSWYEKAKEYGSAEALQRLEKLGE